MGFLMQALNMTTIDYNSHDSHEGIVIILI